MRTLPISLFRFALASCLFVGSYGLTGCSDESSGPDGSVNYAPKNLYGTWQHHSLVVGGEQHGKWIKGTQTNSSSSVNMNFILPSGTYTDDHASSYYLLSKKGVVTSSEDNNLHAFLHYDKQLLIATTLREGGHTLAIQQKMVSDVTYSAADLEGIWELHMLEAGGEHENWTRATLDINSLGQFTSDNEVTSAEYDPAISGHLFLAANGEITLGGEETFHGFMSANKTLMVLNMTSQSGGSCLGIAQKRVPAVTYTAAELQGRWQVHTLLTGSELRTERGLFTLDETGGGLLSEMVKSDGGDFQYHGRIELNLTPDGILTFGEDFHGVVSSDKKLFTGVQGDDSGNAFMLVIVQKML